MDNFEVVKVWEDESSQIIHQNMDEYGATMLSYHENSNLPIDSKFYYEVREMQNSVPINLRLRR